MATWRIRLLKTTVRWHFNYQNLNSNWWTRRIFAAIKPDSGELKRRESRTFCRVVSSDLWQMWSMRLVFRWFFVAGYKLATSYISKFISIPSFFNEMFLLRLLIWKFPVEASYFRSFFFLPSLFANQCLAKVQFLQRLLSPPLPLAYRPCLDFSATQLHTKIPSWLPMLTFFF